MGVLRTGEAEGARVLFLGNKVLATIFIATFMWALFQALFKSWDFGVYGFAAIVFAASLLIAAIVFKRANYLNLINRLSSPKVIVLISALASIAVLIVSQSLSTSILEGTWDFPHLGRDAYNIAMAGTLPDGRDVYCARYPNNQLLLILVSLLFSLVIKVYPQANILDCHHVAILFNALLIIVSVAIMAFVTKKEYGNKAATALILFAIAFLPFWCYSAIYYSDIIPIFFISVELLVFFNLRKFDDFKRAFLWVFLGILGGVAFELKATTVFLFAGFIIYEIIELFGKERTQKSQHLKEIALSLFAFILILVLISNAVQGALNLSDEAYDEHQFPYTHWVMMGLGESGGYSQEDVDFTREAGNKEKKQAANIEVIKTRLKEYGVAGAAEHIFITKVQRTWGSGFLAGDNYINRYPDHEKSFAFSFFSEKGKHHGFAKYFAQIFWLFLLSLLVIGGIKIWRKTISPIIFAAMFTLVLFFAFELMWECNGRYVLHMAPLLLMIAAVSSVSLSRTNTIKIKKQDRI